MDIQLTFNPLLEELAAQRKDLNFGPANPGLTDEEDDAIVAFLNTLTDGYPGP
jgi:cytochrome c1